MVKETPELIAKLFIKWNDVFKKSITNQPTTWRWQFEQTMSVIQNCASCLCGLIELIPIGRKEIDQIPGLEVENFWPRKTMSMAYWP
jgi:hypothetical protein